MEPRATGHLTDEELFGLASPPVGEPEALPPHLLACARCRRALQEWKSAVRELARDEVAPILARTPEEWRAAEDRTLARLAEEGARRRRPALPWAVGLAAALLAAALLVPGIRAARTKASAGASASREATTSELSASDAADDQLLRDVARLSRSDDAGTVEGLVPDPSADREERR
jgi:hypothetical protein